MLPATLNIAQGSIVIINLFVVLGWLIFSFLFWRSLRRYAVEEDRIFDLTFFATVTALVFARLGFVAAHTELFTGKSLLLIVAIWVTPGLSWVLGLVGGVATLVLLSRRYKVRLGLVLDALAVALPLPIILGEVGSLLTGAELGRPSGLPFALPGGDGLARHPVQLYEMLGVVVISILMLHMTARSIKNKWPFGIVGVWFFFSYAAVEFILEFIKDSRVYWGNLTANQWMLIGIFAECIGVLYVRGGGRELFRPVAFRVTKFIKEKGKNIHESISRRHTH